MLLPFPTYVCSTKTNDILGITPINNLFVPKNNKMYKLSHASHIAWGKTESMMGIAELVKNSQGRM